MSEYERQGEPTQAADQNKLLLESKLRYGSVVAGSAAAGGVLGGYIANELFPPESDIAPGYIVKSSIARGEGIYLNNGAIVGEWHFPNIPVDVPVRLDPVLLGGKPASEALGEFSQGNTSSQEAVSSIQELLGLIGQADISIFDPVKKDLLLNIGTGVSIGMLTVSGLAIGIAEFIRRGQRLERAEATIRELRGKELTEEQVDTPRKRSWINKIPRRLAPVALVGALASCGTAGVVYEKISGPKVEYVAPKAELSPRITDLSPLLKGATITGPLHYLPTTIVDALTEQKKSVDSSLEQYRDNLLASHRSFVIGNARYRSLRNNPDLEARMHIGDNQCNFAYIEKVLPAAVSVADPDVVIETGDMDNYAGAAPYEDKCRPSFREKLGDTPYVAVHGNHDKKIDSPDILNEATNYHKEINGTHYVGADDPEDTVFTAVKEEDVPALHASIIAQGEIIARRACEIYEKTGKKPVALAHRAEALAAAILSGCVVSAKSSHTHHEGGIHKYLAADGINTVYQQTVPSISGSEYNLMYDKFRLPGGYTVEYTNKATGLPVAYVRFTFLTDPNKTVKIELIDPPLEVKPPKPFIEYLEKHGHRLNAFAHIFELLPPKNPLETLREVDSH